MNNGGGPRPRNLRLVVFFAAAAGSLAAAACERGAPAPEVEAQPAAQPLAWTEITAAPGGRDAFQQALQRARDSKRPVVVDVGAEWCAPCKKLEKEVFNEPAVKAELQRFERIRVDATVEEGDVTAIQNQLGVLSLPTVAFRDAGGAWLKKPRVTNFVEADAFLAVLKQVQ